MRLLTLENDGIEQRFEFTKNENLKSTHNKRKIIKFTNKID